MVNLKISYAPLKKNKLLIEEIDEEYCITEDGEKHLKKFITHFKYYDVHESDAILLAMSQKRINELLK